ncbi:MAG TPA: BTAD domain-containing putative transcriptional regulator [Propionibacteriaceae bacterium]|nr:BTAD domain-containing putative transcriptional regulator [Propionibacteriaceae bacterium]
MLEIALLGPLEVKRGGQPVPVPSGKASELLVRLALEGGAYVSAGRLLDDLWGADSGNTHLNTLQSKVTMLRRAFSDPTIVTSRGAGYALAVTPAGVDALAASEGAAEASRLSARGDHQSAADLSAATLRLYRGEVLVAAGDGPWVGPHRARLEEVRAELVELHLTSRLRQGDVDTLIGDLGAAVTTYPFREALWELLITALYRAGRQAEALATYQRVREVLATELGLDPGPRLQQLERLILEQDTSLGVPVGSVMGSDQRAGNLPSMTADLIGRAAELATLTELVFCERLVEIVGPGGVGKTATAIAVGRTLALADQSNISGVWLARLENATTADDVVEVLIAAMNSPGGESALLERLRSTAGLVILDNCEHVLDGAASLAVRLLDAAPALRVLCTSQVPLGVEGEIVFELSPLALADAATLFTRRATAQRRTPTSATDVNGVLRICRSLDGLPLAIELAAARTKTLSVEDLTRRLDDRFAVLSDPSSRRPERRRSLRSTISWSYDLLFPDDQRGLWALATFAGGAPLAAVEFVLEALDVPAASTIDVVSRLANRSLLIVDENSDGPERAAGGGELARRAVRYRVLDSIRAFAIEAMTEAGMLEPARAAHAGWFAAAASTSTAGVRSARQAQHLDFARVERANIDAALAWSLTSDPLLGLAIVNGFGWAWVVLGDSRGASRILAALEAAGDTAEPRDRASALLLAGWIEASTGSLELARSHIAAAAELTELTDDPELQARCSYYLAYVVSHSGEFRRAMELTAHSSKIYDDLHRPWDQAASWLFAARAAISAGDQQRSIETTEEVQRWVGTLDDPWLHVRRDAILGELARIQHRFDDAVLHLKRAAERSRRLGFQQTAAYQMASLGRAQCLAGSYDAGLATLELAVAHAEEIGDVRLAALTRVHLGRALRAVGQVARARAILEIASEWHRNFGGGEQAALGECLLATLDAAEGLPGAADHLASLLDKARTQGDSDVQVLALDALGRVALSAGDHATALRLCDSADERMRAGTHFLTSLDRADARWVKAHGPAVPGRRAGSAPRRPATQP